MNYGLYLSASGVLSNTHRQDVFSNNLANVETPGFKPDMPSIRQRDPESIEDQLGSNVSNELMNRLGGGVLAGTQRINFAPGAHRPTGNPLDVALTDKHQFFAVESRDPNTGESSVALTRDGRFTLNSARELITQSGKRVLDSSDQPIVVSGEGQASINKTGNVMLDGEPVSQIQIASIDNLDGLTKRGLGLFAFKGQDTRQAVPTEQIDLHQGFIEASGVDAIMTMMQVVAATKAVTGNARMISYHDKILDQAVNTLGRVG
jgi:flagellar basal-body rod protein FlgF